MRAYQHTQPGTVLRIVMGILMVVFAMFAVGILVGKGFDAAVLGLGMAALSLLLPLLMFHCLAVRVTTEDVGVSLGIGLVRRTVPVAESESVQAIRTRWYNGWGIKKVRHGWLFNVSGFDAVELGLTRKRRLLVGTDEPKKLLAAIEAAMEQVRGERRS